MTDKKKEKLEKQEPKKTIRNRVFLYDAIPASATREIEAAMDEDDENEGD